MSEEFANDIVALYRNAAREVPDERLDRAVLGKARAVAWRRRNRVALLGLASCGTLPLVIGLWSALATTKPPRAVDVAQYGTVAGPAPPYAMNANMSGRGNPGEPGSNANPALMAGISAKSHVNSGGAL